MRIVIFILFISGFIACSSKNEMTVDDLEKASWKELGNGMGHIKLSDSRSKKSDSVQYILMGITQENRSLSPEQFNATSRWLNEILPSMVNSFLPDSDSGYLRISEYHILGNPARTMTVFLEEKYDSTHIKKDLKSLRAIAGVDSVSYISSAMAKEELPGGATPAFKLLIKPNNATDAGMKAISQQINPLLNNVQDIQYPDPLVTDKLTYVKYRRY
jgi:hypothetical protein